jgi:PBP1b-binding outer membrane lipoprotein LpoB
MKRIIAVVALVFMVSGCASFGVWSTASQANIAKFQTFSAQFLAGVKADTPALLAIASMIPQAAPYVPIAQKAITALEAATAAASVVSAVASDPAGVSVSTAQASVSAAVGAVQDAINSAKTGVSPIAPVNPTVSK